MTVNASSKVLQSIVANSKVPEIDDKPPLSCISDSALLSRHKSSTWLPFTHQHDTAMVTFGAGAPLLKPISPSGRLRSGLLHALASPYDVCSSARR